MDPAVLCLFAAEDRFRSQSSPHGFLLGVVINGIMTFDGLVFVFLTHGITCLEFS